MPHSVRIHFCWFAGVLLALGLGGCQRNAGEAPDKATADAGEQSDAASAEDQVTLTAAAARQYQIAVGPVTRQHLRPSLEVPARVALNANAHAHVGSLVQGRAVQIAVQVGDQVEKGAPLIVIESPELGEAQSLYLQQRIAVKVAQAAAEAAKSAFERAKKLFEQSQGVTLNELQKREVDYTVAQGTLQTAESSQQSAAHKLSIMGMDSQAIHNLAESGAIDLTYTVRSPLAGTVIERDTTLGELVSPNTETLCMIADLDTLWVIADVPEQHAAQIVKGAAARVEFSALPRQPVAGRVEFVSPVLDPQTRSVRVRIDVPNPDHSLRPGMFAKASIDMTGPGADTEILAVPEDAVQSVGGQSAVFVPVAGQPNTFAKRIVTAGRPVHRMVPILSGLEEGQEIVTSPSFILKAELGKDAPEED